MTKTTATKNARTLPDGTTFSAWTINGKHQLAGTVEGADMQKRADTITATLTTEGFQVRQRPYATQGHMHWINVYAERPA